MSESTTISGQDLLGALMHASRVIAAHREQLNALNVFPIPDGDTGTNMSLTMKSAIRAATQETGADITAEKVASRVALGSLMGARGNSGVILSQIFRGFSAAIEGCEVLEAADIARALDAATSTAYTAVARPVEGTMLSVIADAARAASAALPNATTASQVLDAAAAGAESGLEHTPEALDVLRKANVVDSGGLGVAYILRAVANFIRGDVATIQIGDEHATPRLDQLDGANQDEHLDESGYCTNFIIAAPTAEPDDIKSAFDAIGNSVVVVGDRALIKVHVHTERPDQAIQTGLGFGSLDKVSIDNMDRQVADVAAAVGHGKRAITRTGEVQGKHAIVAVADGPGLAEALLALGASAVIVTQDEAKPSTEELLRAVEASSTDDVFLLPNASETLGAANIVAGLATKRVTVVPSTSFAGGFAAMTAMQASSSADVNAARMGKAAEQVTYAEISTAVKAAEVDGITVAAGDVMIAINDTVVAASSDLRHAIDQGMVTLVDLEPEIITVFTGRDADAAQSNVVRDALATAWPDADIEFIEGGQAHYHFVIAFD